MPDYSYIKEKLGIALKILATGKGDIRSRLYSAYIEFHTLKGEDFPEELRCEWKWIISKLTKNEPLRDYKGDIIEGSIQQSLKHMQNKTGKEIASKIFEINEALNVKY